MCIKFQSSTSGRINFTRTFIRATGHGRTLRRENFKPALQPICSSFTHAQGTGSCAATAIWGSEFVRSFLSHQESEKKPPRYNSLYSKAAWIYQVFLPSSHFL